MSSFGLSARHTFCLDFSLIVFGCFFVAHILHILHFECFWIQMLFVECLHTHSSIWNRMEKKKKTIDKMNLRWLNSEQLMKWRVKKTRDEFINREQRFPFQPHSQRLFNKKRDTNHTTSYKSQRKRLDKCNYTLVLRF